MEYLRHMETFEEFPLGKLLVNKDSDLYYIMKDNKRYVAWKNVDSVENDGMSNAIIYTNSYYSVIKGKHILTEQVLEVNDKILNNDKNYTIVPLRSILNIKGNSQYELSKSDALGLTGFKEEKAKNPRKTYF